MASLNLGATSFTNESWVIFGSSLKLRIGFINKRFKRVAEKWRFRAQQKSGIEQLQARSAKRSESLRQILKQYGISEESPEENESSSRLDDLSCKEKHVAAVPSSVIHDSENTTEELPHLRWQEKHGEIVSITEDVSDLNHHNCKEKHDAVPSVLDDSKMNTTEELPDLGRQEKYCETVSTTEEVSGQNHHRLPHLRTGALFTSSLLPVLGFCMLCIIGTLHAIISSTTSQSHHHHDGSKKTRWRTALSDRNEPVASEEHETSPEYTVSSTYQEATNEVDEECSKVEHEYKRFLLECGLSESEVPKK
ncbi:uncharacterized protein LOC111209636 isoform X2 [Brassica napus]|uniref:uncharacterized protein LOC111209636 isoform X2 n=1 Tax=Brassica napus TaxID=3708 RepID=UPI000BBE7088|nr:uncharacterized protein LOC111209636 isoform X2 [Brassica napus]